MSVYTVFVDIYLTSENTPQAHANFKMRHYPQQKSKTSCMKTIRSPRLRSSAWQMHAGAKSGRAVVVLKPDQTLTEDDVVAHCATNLARYKLPHSVVFTEALPRNATGKLHKPTLRKLFGDA